MMEMPIFKIWFLTLDWLGKEENIFADQIPKNQENTHFVNAFGKAMAFLRGNFPLYNV